MAGYAEQVPAQAGQRERMTAAMRAMGELDAKDQGEVLLYMAKLRSKRARG